MKWFARFAASALCAGACHGEEPVQTDLGALSDPARRDAEVARLVEADGKKWRLAAYHLLECPQLSGKPALHLLSALRRYDFGPLFRTAYSVEHPEELFTEAAHPPVFLKADLTLIPNGSDLVLLDPQGGQLPALAEPISGSDYFFDFNHDGVLDAAGKHTWTGPDGCRVEFFQLQTIEPQPRVLLTIIYNWVPKDTVDYDYWSYTCSDDDGDGRVEISFGPSDTETKEERRRFVFRCDPQTGTYSAGRIPKGAHIRVLKEGETLEDIARQGGLRYPNKRRDPEASRAPVARPYAFASLKNATSEELIGFFEGRPYRDFWSDDPVVHPNRLPESFWSLPPKAAALAYARENQGTASRKEWNLAIDDREGFSPPASGWWVYSWSSALCYSMSGRTMGIRFGKDKSWLILAEVNFNGAVGSNPFADQTGHSCRCIPLSNPEARFLADTLFWLQRIRGFSVVGKENYAGPVGTSDGFGNLYLAADGSPAVELGAGSIWADSWISHEWRGNYEPIIFANLADHLLGHALTKRLAERWDVAPYLQRRDLRNSVEERLKPYFNSSERTTIAGNLRRIFDLHAEDPLPPPLLAEVAACASGEMMDEFLPELRKLRESLPAMSAEELAAAKVKEGGFTPEAESVRLGKLFGAGPPLRQALGKAVDEMAMASDVELLKKEITDKKDDQFWALRRLRIPAPAEWANQMMLLFPGIEEDQRANLFMTLAAVDPAAAERLIGEMPAEVRESLDNEIAASRRKRSPLTATTPIPELLRIARDESEPISRINQSISLLSGMDLDARQSKDFIKLLRAEWKDLQCDKKDFSSTEAETIRALSHRLSADDFARVIGDQPWWDCDGFDSGVDSIVRVFGPDSRRGRAVLELCLRRGFSYREGLVSHFYMTALAFDLRGLSQRVALAATESAEMPDSIWAGFGRQGLVKMKGLHFHAAREVTALWSEKDPETLARMWICLVANRPEEFSEKNEHWQPVVSALRTRAATAIQQLPQEDRKTLMTQALASAELLPGEPADPAVIRWLTALCET